MARKKLFILFYCIHACLKNMTAVVIVILQFSEVSDFPLSTVALRQIVSENLDYINKIWLIEEQEF